MVYIVVAQGAQNATVEQQIAAIANGWQRLGPGVWLMGSNLQTGVLRDHFRAVIPGIRVGVIRAQGGWATFGLTELAEWLQSAHGIF